MAWLAEYATEIMAIVGALYTIARTVVVLTPTPKDDEALKHVSGFLFALSKTFGLDLKQGLTKTTSNIVPMSFVLLAVTMSGCAWPDNPKANLLASQKLYTATVQSLTTVYRAGKVSETDAKKIDVLIHEGNSFLLQWEADVASGANSNVAEQAFKYVLMKLTGFKVKYLETPDEHRISTTSD
jgi:hypothetical protein